jgi:DNA-binding CsgD family transcriptional regulator
VLDAEPSLARRVEGSDLDDVLRAMADLVDLKSPYLAGHSRGVANLAGEAVRVSGLSGDEVVTVRRAGLFHDLGRLGVPNTIWDRAGPLPPAAFERVRLHPYLTDRMLAQVATLGRVREIASRHHERLDGSGYPRGLTAAALTPSDRAAGRAPARREWPAGLTAREVEVLGYLARGHSNKQIAQQLVVAPKTASNHVEHSYTKLGVSSRAAATLFATQHGLLGTFEPAEQHASRGFAGHR